MIITIPTKMIMIMVVNNKNNNYNSSSTNNVIAIIVIAKVYPYKVSQLLELQIREEPLTYQCGPVEAVQLNKKCIGGRPFVIKVSQKKAKNKLIHKKATS